MKWGGGLNSVSINQFNQVPINIIVANPPYGTGGLVAQYSNFATDLKFALKTSYNTTQKAAKTNLYVMSWFWATKWVQNHPNQHAVVAMITLRSWLEAKTLDGLRKHFWQRTSTIFIVDFPHAGQVFRGVKSPVAIAILVLTPAQKVPEIYYLKINQTFLPTQLLIKSNAIQKINSNYYIKDNLMQRLSIKRPRYNWLEQDISLEDERLISFYQQLPLISTTLSNSPVTVGVQASRTEWVCNFSQLKLAKILEKVGNILKKLLNKNLFIHSEQDYKKFFNKYNQKIYQLPLSFWSRDFYKKLFKLPSSQNNQFIFDHHLVYPVYYVPFCVKKIYYSDLMLDHPSTVLKKSFTGHSNNRNILLSVTFSKNNIWSLVSDGMILRNFLGSNTRAYVFHFTKSNQLIGPEDQYSVLNYAYAILQDQNYQKQFRRALIMSNQIHLPHFDDFADQNDVVKLQNIGHKLVQLHLHYEHAPLYQQVKVNDDSLHDFLMKVNHWSDEKKYQYFKVHKLQFGSDPNDKTVLRFNENITISAIPLLVYSWKVRENKSPLEWVVSQYRIKYYHPHTQLFAVSDDPNDYAQELGNPLYLFELILRLITVSLETVRIKKSYQIKLLANNQFKLITNQIK